MATSLVELRRYIYRVKPWVGVAVLLALPILGYSAVMGMQYSDSSEQVDSLNIEIRRLAASLRKAPPNEEALRAGREPREQRLEAVRSLFGDPESVDLVGILSAMAQESGVALTWLDVANKRQQTHGQVRYWTRPVTAKLQGETQDIYRFLRHLQRKMPMARVTSVSISSLEAVPSAQVQLLFYLSPQAASGN